MLLTSCCVGSLSTYTCIGRCQCPASVTWCEWLLYVFNIWLGFVCNSRAMLRCLVSSSSALLACSFFGFISNVTFITVPFLARHTGSGWLLLGQPVYYDTVYMYTCVTVQVSCYACMTCATALHQRASRVLATYGSPARQGRPVANLITTHAVLAECVCFSGNRWNCVRLLSVCVYSLACLVGPGVNFQWVGAGAPSGPLYFICLAASMSI